MPPRLERRHDQVDQVGLGDLAGREVDPDRELEVGALPVPLAGLAARLVEHPRAEVEDEPGVLGQLDERAGLEQPATGWCQRARASAPTIIPVSSDSSGW